MRILAFLASLAIGEIDANAQTIAFVQAAYSVPQTPQATVTVRYTGAQTAGNLNVVVVGWNDAVSRIVSVADSGGNVYALAAGPTVQTGIQTQVIYFAANIASVPANTNTVTVTFDRAVSYPDVRIGEYRGVARVNPVDGAVGASGTSTTSNSGAVVTTNSNDLLVAANYVQTSTAGPGTGYTGRLLTVPDGNILEDRVVTTTGSYNAPAPLNASGGWVMQLVAFRAESGGTGDTQAPTVPTNVVATGVSSSRIGATWTASTDNVGVTGYRVERCQGAGCGTFVQVGTPATASFSDTGLAAGTSYSYRVRATDAAGNLSGFSAVASATTPQAAPDAQPPTVPTNVVATGVSSSQIGVTWTASTDNVGVTGYRVERCQGAGCGSFVQVGTPATASFSDMGLIAGTSYSYRVRATDAAGNLSGFSPVASATTQTGSTPTPITYVQGTYAVPQTPQTTVAVRYTGPQTVGNLNVVVVGWADATAQVVSVTDTSGNVYTRAVGPTVQTGIQTLAIYFAANILAAGANTNTVTVTFDRAAVYPDVRVVEYAGVARVMNPVDGAVAASGTSTTSNSGAVVTTNANDLLVAANNVQTSTVGPGTGYTGRLLTVPDGNILEDRVVSTPGSYSATAPLSVQGGWVMQLVAFRAESGGPADTQPPTAPTSLVATVMSSSQIALTWTASTDNVGVTGYRVERCQGGGCTNFVQVGASPSPSYSDNGLSGSTTYIYRVRATDASNFSGYSNTASGTTLPAPPVTISISAPTSGDTLTGTVTISAGVSGVGIGGVQFQVDGVNVGPVAAPPYSMLYNTAQFSNGSHTIAAYAWDGQRNITQSSSITVTFFNTNPGNPAATGLWSGLFSWPLVAVHVNMLADGRILAWDKMDTGNPNPQLWDPVTSSFVSVPTNDGANLFCAGSVTLSDGRVISVGGHATNHVGLVAARIFNPATNLWSSSPDMSFGRWYPTVTTLPDGRILTLSGEVNCKGCYADIPEIYNPATNTWTTLSNASLVLQYYPHAFVLPNGGVLVTGTAEASIPTRVLDVSSQTWSTVDSRKLDAYSSAMYLPGKVLKTGRSSDTESGVLPSSANAYVLDMTVPSPRWRQVASMANPRTYHVETLLPDGTVLVTGGGRTTGDYDIPNAVYAAELWSPTNEAWATLSSMHAPRLYHGTALLLADARVLIAGGGRSPGPDVRDQENAEIFAPPYLFKGPRPRISSAPTQLTHNQTFTVQSPDASRIAKVTLVAIGNMTHGINMNQRYLPLNFTVNGSSLTVSAPANANLAPRGIYMLFLVDNLGVPSISSMVRF